MGLVEHSWAQVNTEEEWARKRLYRILQREVVTLWSLSAYTEIQNNFPLGSKEILCSQHKLDDRRFSCKAHSNVNAEPFSQAVSGYKIYNSSCFPLSHTAHWLHKIKFLHHLLKLIFKVLSHSARLHLLWHLLYNHISYKEFCFRDKDGLSNILLKIQNH